jgi:hypothetical protein
MQRLRAFGDLDATTRYRFAGAPRRAARDV